MRSSKLSFAKGVLLSKLGRIGEATALLLQEGEQGWLDLQPDLLYYYWSYLNLYRSFPLFLLFLMIFTLILLPCKARRCILIGFKWADSVNRSRDGKLNMLNDGQGHNGKSSQVLELMLRICKGKNLTQYDLSIKGLPNTKVSSSIACIQQYLIFLEKVRSNSRHSASPL